MTHTLFLEKPEIAIIGLGYVGLPLAIAFAEKGFSVTGLDTSSLRVHELQNHIDTTQEITPATLKNTTAVFTTNAKKALENAMVYIVTVPTPIDTFKTPDVSLLKQASTTIGEYLKPNAIVIYESTVYPGCTEQVCVPALEKASGLVFNTDFYCGYSPERINPGDAKRKVHNIIKVTSGSTPMVADYVDALYQKIVTAGTHKTSSIKIAEAAKVIENTQRDLNISLMNELSLIFDKLNIDTLEVLEAAGTKWNFLPFTPGLVGGHCIGVDPYYLTHKAQSVGYYPEVILSGRRINDTMGIHVANKVVKLMVTQGSKVKGASVLILGFTFKENCPDTRNTRVIDVVRELTDFGVCVSVHDPYACANKVEKEYNIMLEKTLKRNGYDAIILAVGHTAFSSLSLEDLKKSPTSIVFDLKGFFPRDQVTARL